MHWTNPEVLTIGNLQIQHTARQHVVLDMCCSDWEDFHAQDDRAEIAESLTSLLGAVAGRTAPEVAPGRRAVHASQTGTERAGQGSWLLGASSTAVIRAAHKVLGSRRRKSRVSEETGGARQHPAFCPEIQSKESKRQKQLQLCKQYFEQTTAKPSTWPTATSDSFRTPYQSVKQRKQCKFIGLRW